MATTWSSPDGLTSKCVDTTGTGAAPAAATDGFDLTHVGMRNGFAVVYESTGVAFAASTLQAYLWCQNVAAGAGAWVRVPDLDLSVQVLASPYHQGFSGFRVTAPRDRIAFVPSGSGQPGVVWILGTAAGY